MLPPGSEATAPARGAGPGPRPGADGGGAPSERTHHRQARELPLWLEPGDLLVVNTSATLPAALEVQRHGCTWGLHVSAELDDGAWVVELRRPDGAGPGRARRPARCCGCRAASGCGSGSRTRPARPGSGGRRRCRSRTGWPTCAGTARRSATPTCTATGRSRTCRTSTPPSRAAPRCRAPGGRCPREVLVDLMARGRRGGAAGAAHRRGQPGVARAAAAGVAARSRSRPPGWSNSPARPGGRVVAVGTTVVRALETAAGADGRVAPYDGWTSLVLGPDAAGPGRDRAAHRAARAGGQPPRPPRGGGRTGAGGPGVRRHHRAGRAALPVARVRGLDAAAAVMSAPRLAALESGPRSGWMDTVTELVDASIAELRAIHDRLATLVAGLSADAADRPERRRRLEGRRRPLAPRQRGRDRPVPGLAAAGAGEEKPANQEIWDRWNAMAPADQAAAFVRARSGSCDVRGAEPGAAGLRSRSTSGSCPSRCRSRRRSACGSTRRRCTAGTSRSASTRPRVSATTSAALLAEHFTRDMTFLLGFVGRPEGAPAARVAVGDYTIVIDGQCPARGRQRRRDGDVRGAARGGHQADGRAG